MTMLTAEPRPATDTDRPGGTMPDPVDRSLVDAIARRAAAADRGERDLAADVGGLRTAGWLTAPLPRSAGGHGWGTEPGGTRSCLRALRTLGAVSLPVARLFEGHVNAVKLVHRYAEGAGRTAALEMICNGGLLGVWGADRPDAPLRAVPAADGLRLWGTKAFASGLGVVTAAVVSVPAWPGASSTADADPSADAEHAGTRLLLAPADDPARIDPAAWTPVGMRATASGTYRFDGVHLPAHAAIGTADDWFVEPFFEGGVWRYCAAHVGAAEFLFRRLRDALLARGRAHESNQENRLVRAAVAVETARMWTERAADRVEREHAPPAAAAVSLLAREVVQDACRDVIRLTEEALGVAAHLPGDVERTRRDLSLFVCQAAPDAKRARAAAELRRSGTPETW